MAQSEEERQLRARQYVKFSELRQAGHGIRDASRAARVSRQTGSAWEMRRIEEQRGRR